VQQNDSLIRVAAPGDVPRIFEIRDSVGENRLSDPSLVTDLEVRRGIREGALWVCQEGSAVTGFSGADSRDGWIWALFVASGHEGKGIGRALLKQACDALRAAGHREAWLTASPGSRAERHYRADGWISSGHSAEGELIFRKGL